MEVKDAITGDVLAPDTPCRNKIEFSTDRPLLFFSRTDVAADVIELPDKTQSVAFEVTDWDKPTETLYFYSSDGSKYSKILTLTITRL